MPSKDYTILGPGTLFFNTPEGPQPLGGIYEGVILEEAEDPKEKHAPYRARTDKGGKEKE